MATKSTENKKKKIVRKNVGEGAIDAIIDARQNKGYPDDIFRFIENLDIHKINKKAMEEIKYY